MNPSKFTNRILKCFFNKWQKRVLTFFSYLTGFLRSWVVLTLLPGYVFTGLTGNRLAGPFWCCFAHLKYQILLRKNNNNIDRKRFFNDSWMFSIYADDKGMRGFNYFTWRDLVEQSVCGTDRHFCSGTIVQDCLSLHSCLSTSCTGIRSSFQTWISKLIFEISRKRIQNGPCLTLLPGNIYTGGPRDLLTLRPRHLKIFLW